MSQSPAPATPLALTVAFTFSEAWEAGPAGSLSGFPPGGGDYPGPHQIVIAPVNLTGKTPAEIAQIQAQRAREIALVGQAIAVAETQFAAALAAAAG